MAALRAQVTGLRVDAESALALEKENTALRAGQEELDGIRDELEDARKMLVSTQLRADEAESALVASQLELTEAVDARRANIDAQTAAGAEAEQVKQDGLTRIGAAEPLVAETRQTADQSASDAAQAAEDTAQAKAAQGAALKQTSEDEHAEAAQSRDAELAVERANNLAAAEATAKQTARDAATRARNAEQAAGTAEKRAAQAVAPAKKAVAKRADGDQGGRRDDLKLISGIGPKIERMLHAQHIYTFEEIAAFTKADVARVDARLESLKGRIERDGWIAQARLLAHQRDQENG